MTSFLKRICRNPKKFKISDASDSDLNENKGKLPRTLILGLFLVLCWFLMAIFADFLVPYNPLEQNMDDLLQAPNLKHWLGTDEVGRDVLSRIIKGSQIDLSMGIIGVVLPFIIGNVIGLLSGYYGKWVDSIFMRILDITISFPYFVLIIAIVSILGTGLSSFFISLALVGWVSYARIIRTQVLVIKGHEYIMASKSLAYSGKRIIFKHILPNAILPSLVFAMTDVILVVLLGSSLGYLGLGVNPPTPEWGVMIKTGQTFYTQAWWLPTFPGIAILLFALSFSILADGFADYWKVEV